jgi:hypothetical protein
MERVFLVRPGNQEVMCLRFTLPSDRVLQMMSPPVERFVRASNLATA